MLWLISQCSVRIAEDGGMDGGEDNQFYVEINLGFQIKNFTMFNGDLFFFFLVNIYLYSDIIVLNEIFWKQFKCYIQIWGLSLLDCTGCKQETN